ncbi:2TM domain-containing protein [Chryseobacterium sp. 09-1422]|uniref:2TM domain-containing protein n=1 Tax=Chryseobacterium kimseyorum TaxID=2984028 RepID=A0ABT3HVF9_9FLAO|nr:2TM domain-containing protein [Chryseobacterium kimseyorum]MCW3167773.1 2TM domain-containing protein [Chryseobacterium kimseyorum]
MNIQTAQQRVKDLKSFYKNCLWFGIVALIIFFRRFMKSGDLSQSLFSGSVILTVWGIILAVKAVKLFVFDEEWENKILEEEMKKTKKPINF